MTTYRIRSGDTLSGIASRFHTSVSSLAKKNHIANPNLIIAGKSIQVPGHSGKDGFETKGGHHGGKAEGSHHGGGKTGGAHGGGKTGGSHGGGKAEGSHGGGKTGGAHGGGKAEGAGGTSSGGATPAMKRLAKAGHDVAMSMGGYHSQSLCATGVSRSIQKALGISVHGNGNQIDNNLPRSKFKQVNMSLAEALKTPGLILTWEKTASAAGSKYGHTAITTGDGHSSVSDFIERNTLAAHGRTGLKIFRPI